MRRERIFAVASSEGTLHALNYQLSQPTIPLAGLVLDAVPPGRSVGVVAHAQLAEQAAHVPNGEGPCCGAYDAAVADFSSRSTRWYPVPGTAEGVCRTVLG